MKRLMSAGCLEAQDLFVGKVLALACQGRPEIFGALRFALLDMLVSGRLAAYWAVSLPNQLGQ